MPLACVTTSVQVAAAQKEALLGRISRAIAEGTGKPEGYVMATLNSADFLMAGRPGPAAYVDVRGIGGFTPAVNKKLAKALCEVLKTSLGVPADRAYITFTDVPASNWGWNSATFG